MASYSRSSFGSWSVDAVGVLFQLYCGFLNSTGKERRRKSHLNFLITALGLHFTASVGTNCLNNFSPPFFSLRRQMCPGSHINSQGNAQRTTNSQILSLSLLSENGVQLQTSPPEDDGKDATVPFFSSNGLPNSFLTQKKGGGRRFCPPDTIYFFCSDTFLTAALALAIVPFPIFTLLSPSPSPSASFLRKVATPTERMFRLHDTLTPFSLFPFFPCGGWGAVSPPPPVGRA